MCVFGHELPCHPDQTSPLQPLPTPVFQKEVFQTITLQTAIKYYHLAHYSPLVLRTKFYMPSMQKKKKKKTQSLTLRDLHLVTEIGQNSTWGY